VECDHFKLQSQVFLQGRKGVHSSVRHSLSSRSQYMFGLLWIVEEHISGYLRMGWAAPILG
jgi:hypothetical protein